MRKERLGQIFKHIYDKVFEDSNSFQTNDHVDTSCTVLGLFEEIFWALESPSHVDPSKKF